jgi:hypothetical protein
MINEVGVAEPPDRARNGAVSALAALQTGCAQLTSDRRSAEIGLGLAAFGFLFTVLGIMMFFDRGLLAMGNVSVASGRRPHAADALAARPK